MPIPEIDFPVIEKMMESIQIQSSSCSKLQSIYTRVDKYTTIAYGERVRYIAGMAQAITEINRPEGCIISQG